MAAAGAAPGLGVGPPTGVELGCPLGRSRHGGRPHPRLVPEVAALLPGVDPVSGGQVAGGRGVSGPHGGRGLAILGGLDRSEHVARGPCLRLFLHLYALFSDEVSCESDFPWEDFKQH